MTVSHECLRLSFASPHRSFTVRFRYRRRQRRFSTSMCRDMSSRSSHDRKTARIQERYWEDHIRTRFQCQTVRTVCRLPRVWRFSEARNIRRYSFEDYLGRISVEEQQALHIVVATMRVLQRILAPKRVAGLGGLSECQSCGSVGG